MRFQHLGIEDFYIINTASYKNTYRKNGFISKENIEANTVIAEKCT
jgi:hypothetical protein